MKNLLKNIKNYFNAPAYKPRGAYYATVKLGRIIPHSNVEKSIAYGLLKACNDK